MTFVQVGDGRDYLELSPDQIAVLHMLTKQLAWRLKKMRDTVHHSHIHECVKIEQELSLNPPHTFTPDAICRLARIVYGIGRHWRDEYGAHGEVSNVVRALGQLNEALPELKSL